jgi:hypothetical protein
MDSCQLIRKETKMEIVHFDQRQLAARWAISEATLERWRSEGIGPKFLKLFGRVLPMNDANDSVAGRAGHRSFTREQSDAQRRPADPKRLPVGTHACHAFVSSSGACPSGYASSRPWCVSG